MSVDLTKYSKKELEEALRVVTKMEDDKERHKQLEKNRKLVLNLPAILLLVEHGRTSCSDDNPMNGDRCARCFLLEVADSGYLDETYDVNINVSVTQTKFHKGDR